MLALSTADPAFDPAGPLTINGFDFVPRPTDLTAENAAQQERWRTEFLPAILHGDDEHRAWLTASVDAFLAGQPVPRPTGSGNKEALIAAQAALIETMREALEEVDRHFGPFAEITINGQHDPDDVRVIALVRATLTKSDTNHDQG